MKQCIQDSNPASNPAEKQTSCAAGFKVAAQLLYNA